MGMPEPCRDGGCQEKGKTALRHQHMALPGFAPAKFLLGLNMLFFRAQPTVNLPFRLLTNCQRCNLLALGQLARFLLSFKMSYFSIPGGSRIYTIYLWLGFLPVI